MVPEMEIDEEVNLIADVFAGGAGDRTAYGVAGGVVEGVLGLIEAEDVPLGVERDPFGRVHVVIEIEVVDVFAADQIQEAEVVMAEGKQLIERVVVSGIGIAV